MDAVGVGSETKLGWDLVLDSENWLWLPSNETADWMAFGGTWTFLAEMFRKSACCVVGNKLSEAELSRIGFSNRRGGLSSKWTDRACLGESASIVALLIVVFGCRKLLRRRDPLYGSG